MKKEVRIGVVMTEKEKKELIAYCKASGLSISTLVRHLVSRTIDGDIKLSFKR